MEGGPRHGPESVTGRQQPGRSDDMSETFKDRAPREDLEIPVEVGFEDAEHVLVGLSVNISETGMLFRSEEPRPKGSIVRFEFRPRFSGYGEVVWSKVDEDGKTILGIRFKKLSRGGSNVLVKLLDEAEPED
jgi:hypothetical protein